MTIFYTEIKEGRVFIIAPLTIAVVRAEQQYGIKIEPTGLQNDEFGLSYARRYGRVFNSLKEFKKAYDKGSI